MFATKLRPSRANSSSESPQREWRTGDLAEPEHTDEPALLFVRDEARMSKVGYNGAPLETSQRNPGVRETCRQRCRWQESQRDPASLRLAFEFGVGARKASAPKP